MELQVIKCIVVTTTVSWHRGQSFYSSLPLIAWVMLFLTFLCEGVLRAQWAFCFTPSNAFSGQTGTSSCQWIRSPATSQLPGEQSAWVVCLPASLSLTEGCNSSILKPVLPYNGVSHRGNGPFETPHKGNYLHSVPSRNRDSRHGLLYSLPLVKAPKTQSSQLKQDIPMYCLEPFPHKDWPNLTLISRSNLVSHVNMKGS